MEGEVQTRFYYWAVSEHGEPVKFCVKDARDRYLKENPKRRMLTPREGSDLFKKRHAKNASRKIRLRIDGETEENNR